MSDLPNKALNLTSAVSSDGAALAGQRHCSTYHKEYEER